MSTLKYTIAFLALSSSISFAEVDWKLLKKTDPPREYWSDGKVISPGLKKDVNRRDLDPNGWRFDLLEWRKMVTQPRYKKDKVHGSNGGYEYA